MLFGMLSKDNDGGGNAKTRKNHEKPLKEPWKTWDTRGVIQDILANSLDLTGLKDKEITELCIFIAHGCVSQSGADLSSYCHAMSNGNYEASTNRIIRHLIDGVEEIWGHESNQQKLFPDWFVNRDEIRDVSFVTGARKYVPSNVAATYRIYNIVAEQLADASKWHSISGRHEPPRLVPLNVS